ncbi:hypothetical protein VFPFJ_01455 [Purpureocillium lilacinum]|uniref:Uncharacterized protein n=1 Tax=Purpureocillium lilacinum TaxID=33203 RepID=A0A179HXT9_PURLI|nr:hypothetical protein VFPFJ_01455 [Purpureocillium lilacinum]OAQ87388.1 hypothetical protein VFPBJ_01428 [Purpureocillium lilacinum]OAQ95345.1 hypothetical protein VFPFJ_01455 [Purpureocillium lilacinum]
MRLGSNRSGRRRPHAPWSRLCLSSHHIIAPEPRRLREGSCVYRAAWCDECVVIEVRADCEASVRAVNRAPKEAATEVLPGSTSKTVPGYATGSKAAGARWGPRSK